MNNNRNTTSNVKIIHKMLDGRIVDDISKEKLPDDHPIYKFIGQSLHEADVINCREESNEVNDESIKVS